MILSATIVIVLGTAFLAVGDVVVEDGRIQFDRWLTIELHRFANPGLTRGMQLVTGLGSASITVPFILVLAGGLLWRHQKRRAIVVASFWIGAQIIDLGTKYLYHRARPTLFPAFARADGYSFPSGHTVTAVLTYGLIAAVVVRGQRRWRRWLPIVLAVVVVIAVSTSRVYLGVHYPSDVIGGLLIGGTWLQIAILVLVAVEGSPKSLRSD